MDRHTGGPATAIRLLAAGHPGEPAVESLRSLRTALQFAMSNARNNVILISGTTPGVGKSFVCANFAALLAASGKRVLLIDADLRRGSLHRYFGLQRERGMADVVADLLPREQVVYRNIVPNLDFMATGALPPNPAELLLHRRVAQLIEASSGEYDVVLVDSPPVLAVTDAVMLSEHCATVMLVARAGVTRAADLAECVRRFAQASCMVTGAILNGIDPRSARRSYGRKNGTYRFVQYASYEPCAGPSTCWRRLLARFGRSR
jgi:tyrosine-protein kinase Etk/Wzc